MFVLIKIFNFNKFFDYLFILKNRFLIKIARLLFNENISEDLSHNNNDMLFRYIENASNKRNILPDVDYLLANYSTNQNIKRK